MNIKTQRFLRLTFSYIVLALASAIVIFPVLWIIGSSLNPGNSLSNSSMFPKMQLCLIIKNCSVLMIAITCAGIGIR